MTNRNNYEDEIFVEQPEFQNYYYPPMFQCPYEESYEMDGMRKIKPTTGTTTQHTPLTPMDETTMPPSGPAMGDTGGFQQEPTLQDIGYTQAFLRTQIGKRVRVSFLIGTQMLVDRTGILTEVGISYIILRIPESNTRVLCDLYSIKFVDFYNS